MNLVYKAIDYDGVIVGWRIYKPGIFGSLSFVRYLWIPQTKPEDTPISGNFHHDGLQGWSVGPIYPWSVRIIGVYGQGEPVHQLQAINLISGQTGPIRTVGQPYNFGDTHDLCEHDARFLSLVNSVL